MATAQNSPGRFAFQFSDGSDARVRYFFGIEHGLNGICFPYPSKQKSTLPGLDGYPIGWIPDWAGHSRGNHSLDSGGNGMFYLVQFQCGEE
jgi:hypothetical protein